jgi:uncharacterized protein YkwD
MQFTLGFAAPHLQALFIPHPRNNHRPFLIRHYSLYAFLFLFVAVQFAANVSNGAGKVLGYATSIDASQVISLTNNQRAAAGLSALKENSLLSKAAGLKANDMFEKDYWAHFAPDGTSPWYFFGLVGYQYVWAGENLAKDFSTSQGVVNAWMGSAGHKANILNSNFSEIGLAVVNGNLSGEDTTLVVQLFGKPTSSSSKATGAGGDGSPPSQPTSVEANLEANQPEQTPATSSSLALGEEQSGPSPNPLLSLIQGVNTGQRVTLLLLTLVFLLFVIDSVIIYRARHARVGSHSLAHAAIILVLIASILLYGKGLVL